MSAIDRARVIAKIAHQGQRYGRFADYFGHHVQGVVDLCERNRHCTYGAVEVAYLHDVLEDTEVSAQDLLDLGVAPNIVDDVRALTRNGDEQYMDYIARVCRAGMTPMFVKYHDLVFNSASCRLRLTEREDPVVKAKSESLLRRYALAMQALKEQDIYFLYEE